jgi:hypothetical protein
LIIRSPTYKEKIQIEVLPISFGNVSLPLVE